MRAYCRGGNRNEKGILAIGDSSEAFTIVLLVFALFAVGVAMAGRWLKRPLDFPSFALFFLLPVIFLFPGFFGGGTPLPLDHVRASFAPWNAAPHPEPYNPSLSDVATQFAPWAEAVRMAWKEGSPPFWDRWNGCGTPLAANGQSQAFSPFTFLTFALPLARSFVLLGASKLFLALCGMFLWLKELGTSPAAARFGAVAFAFSFAMTPWLYHPASAEICLWPWVFLAVELLADAAISRRAFAALALLLAVLPLCGHLETVALGALFGVLWFGLRALSGDIRNPSSVLGRACLAALIALGLSAFSLLPQLAAIEASNRAVLAKDPSRFLFVPWVPYRPGWLGGFVTSLFPRAFGDMIDSPMIPGAAGSIVEMGFGYFGVIGWIAALLVLAPGSRRKRREWILLALLLFGLGGAMGLPLLRAVVASLPGIRLLPPLRLLLLVSAAGAPLAAFGIDRLLTEPAFRRRGSGFILAGSLGLALCAGVVFLLLRRRHAALGGLSSQSSALLWTLVLLLASAVVAVFFAHKALRPEAFAGLLTTLLALELAHQGMRLYRFSAPADLHPEPALIRFLRSRPLPYRIGGDSRALFPNTNVFVPAENIATHDPAERRDYVEFLDKTAGYPAFEYFKAIRDWNSPALDFLNVKYLVTPPGRPAPGQKWAPVYDGADGKVFENRNALPRLFAPGRIRLVPPAGYGRAAAVNAVRAFGNPLDELLRVGSLAAEAVVLESAGLSRRFLGGQNGSVDVAGLTETTNRIRFSASVSRGAAILVSSLVTDGGWSAREDSGKEVTVSLANGPFLALCLPPGRHVVTLTYVPPGFRTGIGLGAAAALALAAFLSLSRHRAFQAGER